MRQGICKQLDFTVKDEAYIFVMFISSIVA